MSIHETTDLGHVFISSPCSRLTRMSLVVFQHVDLLGELAVTLLTLVLFDALVKLHVVPQSVFGFHACTRKDFFSMTMIKTSATAMFIV